MHGLDQVQDGRGEEGFTKNSMPSGGAGAAAGAAGAAAAGAGAAAGGGAAPTGGAPQPGGGAPYEGAGCTCPTPFLSGISALPLKIVSCCKSTPALQISYFLAAIHLLCCKLYF